MATHEGRVVHAVLTQRLLLSLIASFQQGPSGVVVPLVRRLVDDGLVQCTVRVHWVGWYDWRESHRIRTPLCNNIRPKQRWIERMVPDAIGKYDTSDLHTLRTLVAASAFASKPTRSIRRLLHRVAEAAAAYGRIDILESVHTHYNVFIAQTCLLPFCVKRATRHGQIAVLAWIESTFSRHSLDALRHYDLHAVIQQHNVEMIRWLATRTLGLVPARSLRFAAEHGNVRMLRVLLENVSKAQLIQVPQDPELVAFAMQRGQYEAVAYLVGERSIGFTTTTLDKAIALRHLTIVQYLLDHRDSLIHKRRPNLVSPALVQQLIGSNDVPMLEMLASVKDPETLGCSVMTCCHFARPSIDALRLLLPLSSAEDVAVTLIRFAVRQQNDIVDTILEGAKKPIASVVLAFVDRLLTDTLGPMVTLAMTFVTTHDNAILDEMLALVPKTTRDDVLDTVLRLLPGPAFPLTSVLKADANRAGAPACDEAFLQLCLSLRQSERDTHHKAIQQYLHTRKKPKAVPPSVAK